MRSVFSGFNYLRGLPLFLRDYVNYASRNQDPRFPLRSLDTFPCLFDRFDNAGIKPRHYFHQDLWGAKKVFRAGVQRHADFGSRIDGFVAHCASFCQITVYDIRPLQDLDENIRFKQANLTNLAEIPSGSLLSVSSLHVFEHIGLGRYGDPVGSSHLDKAASEITRVIAPGGDFYFSVPIGIQRLEFNSQRVFAVKTVLDMFSSFRLVEFSAVNDADDFIKNAALDAFENAEFSCGLFHFRKL
jgi:hypothetical protein